MQPLICPYKVFFLKKKLYITKELRQTWMFQKSPMQRCDRNTQTLLRRKHVDNYFYFPPLRSKSPIKPHRSCRGLLSSCCFFCTDHRAEKSPYDSERVKHNCPGPVCSLRKLYQPLPTWANRACKPNGRALLHTPQLQCKSSMQDFQ